MTGRRLIGLGSSDSVGSPAVPGLADVDELRGARLVAGARAACETGETSTSVAPARRAPTVHSARGREVNGSKRKWRMALRWVIWSISSSATPSMDGHSVSGEMGQVESECG